MEQTPESLKEINQRLLETQKKLEKEILERKESERIYRTLFEQNIDPTLLLGDGIFTDCNNAAITFLGYDSKEGIVGKTPFELSPEYQFDGTSSVIKAKDRIEEALEKGKCRFEWLHQTKDGANVWVDVALMKIDLGGEEILYTIWRDISESKQAELELKASEEKFRIFMDHLPAGIFIKDEAGAYEYINKYNEQNLGVKNWRGRTAYDFFKKEIADKFTKEDQRVLTSGAYKSSVGIKNSEDKDAYFTTQYFPINKPDGTKLIGGISLDITSEVLATKALEESEKKLKNIANNLPGIVFQFQIDSEGKYQFPYLSSALLNYYDFKIEDVIKDPSKLLSAIHDLDKGKFFEAIETSRQKLNEFEIEFRIWINPERYVWAHAKSVPELLSDGTILWTGIAIDITEQKLMEEKQKEVEKKYRNLVDWAPEGIYRATPEGKFLFVNKRLAEILEYDSTEELIKLNVSQIYFNTSQRQTLIEEFDNEEKGFAKNLEIEWKKKNGEPIWISLNAHSVRAENGETQYFEGFVSDISSRKKAELELEESQERFRLAMDATSDGIYDWNLKTNAVYYSPAWIEMLGYNREEIKDSIELWEQLTSPKDVNHVYMKLNKSFETKSERFELEFQMKHKDGRWIDISSRGQIFYDTNGQPKRMIGTHSNITEKKKHILELEKRNQFIQKVLDNLPIGITLNEINSGKTIYINKKLKEIYGWDLSAMKDANEFFDRVFPDEEYRSLIKEKILTGIRSGIPEKMKWSAIEITPKGGRKKIIDAQNIPLFDQNIVVGVIVDVTEQRNAETALRKSEELYKRIYENAQIGIYRTKVEDGTLLMANQRMAELFGYDTINEALDDYITSEHYVYENSRKEILNMIQDKGRFNNYEAPLTTKKGEVRWFQYSGELYKEEGYIEGVASDITERKAFEDELKRRNDFIQTVMDNLPIGVLLHDIEGRKVSYVNKKYEEFIGWPASIIKNSDLFLNKIFPDKKYREEVIAKMTNDIFSGELEQMQWTKIEVKHQDGSTHMLDLKNIPLYEQDTMVVTAIDVTEQKRAEEELVASEQKYRAFFENDLTADYLSTPEGKILDCNPAFAKILGYDSVEEVLTVHPNQFYEQSDIRNTFLKKLKKEKKILNREINLVKKDGEIIHLVENAIGIFDKKNRLIQFQGYMFDITSRKKAETALKNSEEKYRTLTESSKDNIYIFNRDMRLEFVNLAGAKTLGGNQEDFYNKHMSELFPPEIAKRQSYAIKEIFRTKKSRINVAITQTNKIKIWLESTLIPIKDEDGKVNAVMGVSRDITDRKEAEEKLRQSEEKYRLLVENQTDLIVKVNPEGVFEFVSNSYCKMFGKTEKQLVGKTFMPLVHKDDIAKTQREMRKLYKPPHNCYVEQRAKTINGWKYLGWSDKAILNDEKQVVSIIGVGRDITDRKIAEQKVFEEKRKAENYLETAEVMMIALDTKGNISMINKKGTEMLGYTRKYILGKNWFGTFVIEEKQKEAKKIFGKIIKGTTQIDKYEVNEIRCRYNKIKTISWHNNILTDDNRKVIGTLSSGVDITETIKLQKELESSNKQLEKLTAFLQEVREEERSNLARELHDDLGQSLTALKLDISQISKQIDIGEVKLNKKVNSAYKLVDESVQTVQRITSDLRPGMIDDLGLISTMEWYISEYTERSNINVKMNIDIQESVIKQELKISIYRLMQEALTNVARHSKASKAKINFKQKGEHIELSISDNGIGIKEEQINNPNSFGMIGMKERVLLVGGQFEVRINKKGGTKIIVSLPLK